MKKNLIKCAPLMGFAVCALALSSCAHTLTASAAKALFDSYESAESYEKVVKISNTVSEATYTNDVLQTRTNITIHLDRTATVNAETGAISGDNLYLYGCTDTYVLGTETTATVSTKNESLITKVGSKYYQYTNDNGTYSEAEITAEVAYLEVSIVYSSLQTSLIPANNSLIYEKVTGEEDPNTVYEQSGESLSYKYVKSETAEGASTFLDEEFAINSDGLLSTYSSNSTTTSQIESNTLKTSSTHSILALYDISINKLSNLGDRVYNQEPSSSDSESVETPEDSTTVSE